MGIKDMERPERRTVLVCRELVRFGIDMSALSETKLVEDQRNRIHLHDLLERDGDKRTIYPRGWLCHEKNLVEKQNLIQIVISDGLMTFRLSHDSFLTSFPSMHLS